MPELSIIVPVYKVEKYLPKCIDSILAQTFTDFELILIDDGSPDRCGEICDEYAKKDERIIVIHQENKGVSAARNAGLDIARGEYISIIDSDDFLEINMYQKMLSIAKLKNVEVVIAGVNYCDELGNIIRKDLITEGYYDNEQLLSALFAMPNPIGGGCWNKIFKNCVDSQIFFKEDIKFAEDWLYLFEKINGCKAGYQISSALYNVVERVGSATRSNQVESMYKIILGSELLLKRAQEHSKNLESKAMDKFLDNCIRYVTLMKEEAIQQKQRIICKRYSIKLIMLKNIIHAYIKNILPKSKLHGYIYGMLKL